MLSSIIPLTLMASAASGESTERIEKPQEIVYGASVEETKSRLEKRCDRMNVRTFDPPKVPLAKISHSQIDCFGFDFMGEPRKAEFVFVDGKLQFTWVMVDADDQERIIAAMRKHYKADGLSNKAAIAFPEHRTAWRFEPPEVLFYSEEVAPAFERMFGSAE